MDNIQEIKEQIQKKPSYLTENEDGTYTLELRKEKLLPEGKLILEELNGEAIESCTKLAEKIDKDMEILLARRSCVEPKLTDNDFVELKGSNYMKIKFAIMYVYGFNDFL